MSEKPQFSPEASEQAMRQRLIESVKALGPEDLLTKEKAETCFSALDLFFRDNQTDLRNLNTMNEEVRRYNKTRPKGVPRHVILTKHSILTRAMWPIQELARTLLTYPLPGQSFEYEEDVPEEAKVADKVDWWSILDDQQKRAFSDIFRLDLRQGDTYKPPLWKRWRSHIFATGQLITVPKTDDLPSTSFYPTLVWIGKSAEDPHGFALGAMPASTLPAK